MTTIIMVIMDIASSMMTTAVTINYQVEIITPTTIVIMVEGKW